MAAGERHDNPPKNPENPGDYCDLGCLGRGACKLMETLEKFQTVAEAQALINDLEATNTESKTRHAQNVAIDDLGQTFAEHCTVAKEAAIIGQAMQEFEDNAQ